MRVLVTGGTGRLGLNVCKSLIQAGHRVRILDLDTRRNRQNVRDLDKTADIFWGDVMQPASVRAALDQVGLVVHMAAILPPLADSAPELARKVNVEGTKTLIEAVKEKQKGISLIYTSSVAVFGPTPDSIEPISTNKNQPRPQDAYAETKFQAENLIRQSGLDFVILRLTATPYLSIKVSDVRRMFSIPINNRVEFCHPDDTALAIVNTVEYFDAVKGKTLIISGGNDQRMLYKDMVGGILNLMGMPLPPEKKFTREPYYLDWYDTSESERLLRFQRHSFADYLKDFARGLSQRYTKLFVPFMRRFISPLLGKAIVQFM